MLQEVNINLVKSKKWAYVKGFVSGRMFKHVGTLYKKHFVWFSLIYEHTKYAYSEFGKT